MATLKHINSKNADYGAAEQYLLFEHDEFTMKPVLDETGRLIPREDYRLSTLNCGGEAVVMPVRVGAYKGLVAGEMLGAKLLAQLLRPVYGQAVVRAVPWVKADDIVVAFHIFPPLVLLIAEICPHTGNGKILPAAVQRGQPVVLAGDKPAGFIKDGLHGKLVMFKKQVLFGGSVVGIFRVDMLECCQLRHLLS